MKHTESTPPDQVTRIEVERRDICAQRAWQAQQWWSPDPDPGEEFWWCPSASSEDLSERIVSVCFRKQRRNKMATGKERDKEHGKGHLAMNTPPIVSQQEWEAARQQLLVKEKALTRSRDTLAAERRRMPWMAVEKKYEFDGPKGKVSLLDLFEGSHQLIVYRAFFDPGVFGWPEHACRGCSVSADQVAASRDLTGKFVRRLFSESPVRTALIIFPSPSLYNLPGFGQGPEPVSIQAFGPKGSVG
jgi:Bacterial protein of unknown function (DUF899)